MESQFSASGSATASGSIVTKSVNIEHPFIIRVQGPIITAASVSGAVIAAPFGAKVEFGELKKE